MCCEAVTPGSAEIKAALVVKSEKKGSVFNQEDDLWRQLTSSVDPTGLTGEGCFTGGNVHR